jgi:hypothetical protein
VGNPVQKVSTIPLQQLIKIHGLSVEEIARRTGQSVSAIYTWLREGKMPAVMRPACAGILAQMEGEAHRIGKPTTLIVQVPPGKEEDASKLLDVIGAKYLAVEDLWFGAVGRNDGTDRS